MSLTPAIATILKDSSCPVEAWQDYLAEKDSRVTRAESARLIGIFESQIRPVLAGLATDADILEAAWQRATSTGQEQALRQELPRRSVHQKTIRSDHHLEATMYDYMLEEMADAISKDLHVDNAAALRVLAAYWQDKIAHVWQVDDLLETAHRAGKPITRADAAELLHNVFDRHDSNLGISWTCLEVEIEGYQLDFASLPAEKCGEIHGVFKVWREHDPIAHQFGMFPNQVEGNFIPALDFARALAREQTGRAVLLGCESSAGDETKPWLVIEQQENGALSTTESEVLNHGSMD